MLGCDFGPGLALDLFSQVVLEVIKLSLSTDSHDSPQMGADVPAESFALNPFDRIFVRMGAKDQIMAGQSTFLTELLETAAMLVS